MRTLSRLLVILGLMATLLLSGCTSAQPPAAPQGTATQPTPTPAASTLEQEKKQPLTPTPSQPAALKWPDSPKATEAELNNAAIKANDLIQHQKAGEALQLLTPLAGAKHREVQIALGVAEYQNKDLDAAAEAYLRATQVDPQSAVAQNNLGNVYRDQKKYDLAAAAYQKAIDLDSTYVTAIYNFSSMLQMVGRLAWAEDVLHTGVIKNPKNAQLYINLGNILVLEKRPDEARAAFEAAQKIDPNNPGVKQGLDALKK